jgi:hypothetical protein
MDNACDARVCLCWAEYRSRQFRSREQTRAPQYCAGSQWISKIDDDVALRPAAADQRIAVGRRFHELWPVTDSAVDQSSLESVTDPGPACPPHGHIACLGKFEAVGLAFAITSAIAFAVANITPTLAVAIATTIQIARWLGSQIGSAVIQTFVRVREQIYSNLIGLHVVTGLPATAQATAQLAGPFGSRATGFGEPAAQGTAVLASIVRREAYVRAYVGAFWLIARSRPR